MLRAAGPRLPALPTGEVRAPWLLSFALLLTGTLALEVPPSRVPTNGITGGGGPWPFRDGEPNAPPRPPPLTARPGAILRTSPLLCPKAVPLGLDARTGEGEAEEGFSLGRRSLESDRRPPAPRESRRDSAATPSFSLSRERIRSRRRSAIHTSTSRSLAITRRTRPWLPRPPSMAAAVPEVASAEAAAP